MTMEGVIVVLRQISYISAIFWRYDARYIIYVKYILNVWQM